MGADNKRLRDGAGDGGGETVEKTPRRTLTLAVNALVASGTLEAASLVAHRVAEAAATFRADEVVVFGGASGDGGRTSPLGDSRAS
jgi:hypothetical protein